MVREILEGQLAGLKETLLREGVDLSRMKVQSAPKFDAGNSLSQSHARSHEGNTSSGAARFDGEEQGSQESAYPDQASPAARAQSRSASHDGDLNVFV